jgi:hypothetical protein
MGSMVFAVLGYQENGGRQRLQKSKHLKPLRNIVMKGLNLCSPENHVES